MARNRLRDLDVREVSFVDKGAVREIDANGQAVADQPMRFLLWKAEDECPDCPDEIDKAQLSSGERDALPDSAFADPENRAYPIKKKDGSWDVAHIRNARARCADPKNTCGPQVRKRIEAAAKAAGVGDVSKEEITDVDLQEALAIVQKAAAGGGLTDEQRDALLQGQGASDDSDDSDADGGSAIAGLLKDEKMPAAVRKYLQSVEERLNAAPVSKSEVPPDEELLAILKDEGVVPAVRSMLEKAESRARTAEEEAKRLRLEKAEDQVRVDLEKAEKFIGGLSYLGVSDEARVQVAKALFVLRREDADAAGELENLLKAQNTRMQTSALWKSLGVTGDASQRHGSAASELQARAVELRKSQNDLSIDQARVQILEEDADLARRLDEEGVRE